MALRSQLCLSQVDADRVADQCLESARSAEVAVCIAVTDHAGHLLRFTRMDGAPLLSVGLSQDKAWSVTAFNGLPTDAWWSLIGSDPALVHGITKTDRLVVFGGGQPVLVNGELAGAVGISGGSAAQDTAIAAAGAAFLLQGEQPSA